MKNELNITTRIQFSARNSRLREHDLSYRQYLSSKIWIETKDYFKKEKGFDFCFCCQKPPADLHHIRYTNLFSPRIKKRCSDIRALCRRCHEDVHLLTTRTKTMGLVSATRNLRRLREGRKVKKIVKDAIIR